MNRRVPTPAPPAEDAVTVALQQPRIVIADISPGVIGDYPVKSTIGQTMMVSANIFCDGHEPLAAELVWCDAGSRQWQRQAMQFVGNDHWQCAHLPAVLGVSSFAIEARIVGDDAQRGFLARSPVLRVDVERTAAGFASWYELFPRSQTDDARRHGTLDDVIARLPAIRAMGFDTLYLPPIHPIGSSKRKGRNNALAATTNDPGSCYAIGSNEGGHDAVHPALGGVAAFKRLVAAARVQKLELALDFAIQCSPDHPWISEHPQWFSWRADGTLQHAENPPKKYEDIVNVDFYCADAAALWQALRAVVLYWISEGVNIFRVDNPHTKPLPFWEWLIASVRAEHPQVIFLSEAFTRPAMMYRLAQIGFAQSYTYFTWRNTKADLTQYFAELTQGRPKDFYRPHLFVNTPDINPYFLQTSGRAGFVIRAALACSLSGLWGMYSGFELCEAMPLPGKEEYLDSEKFEIKPRDWSAAGNIVSTISQLNRIRLANPALHSHLGLRFHAASNDRILYFSKATADRSNILLIAISLDPHLPQEAWFELPLAEFGWTEETTLEVEELMRGWSGQWQGKAQHWRLIPQEIPVAIWRIAHG